MIRVEADGTQRLWRFTIDGLQPELVLADVKPVGYHAWADDHTLALFVLGQPATLQIADTRTGKADVTAVAGAKEADCAWTPDGMLLMADKDVLYGWRRGQADWIRLADLATLGLRSVSRLAVSPDEQRIALVTQNP